MRKRIKDTVVLNGREIVVVKEIDPKEARETVERYMRQDKGMRMGYGGSIKPRCKSNIGSGYNRVRAAQDAARESV